MDRSDRRRKQFAHAQNFNLTTFLERFDVAAERDRVGHDNLLQMRIRNILCRVTRQHTVRKKRVYIFRTSLSKSFCDLANSAAGIAHIVDDQTVLSVDIAYERFAQEWAGLPGAYAPPPLPERIAEARTSQAAPNIFAGEGLTFERRFTREGEDVFDTTEWELRTAAITGEGGQVYFEQKDVEVPAGWSQMATNVVVQKYFRGVVGTPSRERSVRQLIGRVVDTITGWGTKQHYFRADTDAATFSAELTHLLVEQKMSFNSPV